MNKLVLAALLVPTLGFAKLGDTRDEAEARWGKPISSQDATYGYETNKYTFVQMYGTDGKCFVSMYYKKDGLLIEKTDSDRLDAVNVTKSGITWHEIDSGSPGITQWNSQDDSVAIIAGLVPKGNQNVYCRGYLTAAGFAYVKEHGFLATTSDVEKETTN